MGTICYYCQRNDATDYPVINPMTRQVEPTCRVCEYEFKLLAQDQKKFSVLSVSGKALMALSILILIMIGWKAALIAFVFGLASSIVAVSGVGARSGQRGRQGGKFAKEQGLFSLHADRPEPDQITWCRNCVHFRKIAGWEGLGGLYSRDAMPSESCLPCKLLPKTEPVWARFFAVPSGEKRLYPTDCPCFERSSRE